MDISHFHFPGGQPVKTAEDLLYFIKMGQIIELGIEAASAKSGITEIAVMEAIVQSSNSSQRELYAELARQQATIAEYMVEILRLKKANETLTFSQDLFFTCYALQMDDLPLPPDLAPLLLSELDGMGKMSVEISGLLLVRDERGEETFVPTAPLLADMSRFEATVPCIVSLASARDKYELCRWVRLETMINGNPRPEEADRLVEAIKAIPIDVVDEE